MTDVKSSKRVGESSAGQEIKFYDINIFGVANFIKIFEGAKY
jgi:hypothetical protein